MIGTSTSAEKAAQIRALGAESVALDLLDPEAVRRAVRDAAPDAIVHQATALADATFGRNFDRTFAGTNRLRTEGTCSRSSTTGRASSTSSTTSPRMREWLPAFAEALGAKPPRRVPVWLARLVAGEAAVATGTEARGASNAKAKRELGWQPSHPTWREGFRVAYAPARSRFRGAGAPVPVTER